MAAASFCRGRPAWALLTACMASAARGHEHSNDGATKEPGKCSDRFVPPQPVPVQGTDHNGAVLQDVCISSPGPEYEVYLIGDWGGLTYSQIPNMPPVPADKRSKLFPRYARDFVHGIDDRAQLLVAEQMRLLALEHPPDYLLNVGDNFYWGGVDGFCGKPAFDVGGAQFRDIFEQVYYGAGLEGKTWLGVLGNHDYGGYQFVGAWDQAIGYSWGLQPYSTNRWLTVAQYWLQRVNYPTFSVEYYMVDSNVFETWPPSVNGGHNICGAEHNPPGATCGAQGPHNLADCGRWFAELWEKQMHWMEEHLESSTATWQVIVTHFPPTWGLGDWTCLADRYGVDLLVTGHVHYQQVVPANADDNPLGATPYVITGGGGGITAESPPSLDGHDDAYGFVRMTLSKEKLRLTAISHGGVVRSVSTSDPRGRNLARRKCSDHDLPVTHFEDRGGEDQACRTEKGDSFEDYVIFDSVASMLACQRHCRNTALCTAVEYGNHVCKVFTQPVTDTVELAGYRCMTQVKSPESTGGHAVWAPVSVDLDRKPKPATATDNGKAFLAETLALGFQLGRGRACRGDDVADEGGPQYTSTIPVGAPTFAGCERACLSVANCTGVQYGPDESCKLWHKPIRASVALHGAYCLPRQAGVADLVELAGQLHI